MAKRSKPKPVVPCKAWALVRPDGSIDVDTVQAKRKWAIHEGCSWVWNKTTKQVWASHRAQGWRVVKVEIREVPHGKAK